jgi:hypothetical protein
MKKSAQVKALHIQHYTFKRCKMTNDIMALCLHYEHGRGWALDRVHPVGECPYCEYKEGRPY